MITKREIKLIVITVLIMSIPLVIIAHKNNQVKILPSSVYDWNEIKATPTPKGESRKFFDSPTSTLDQLECHVTTLNPGEMAHPPHQHAEEELIIVKEGMVEVLVNSELKRVGPGSVIFQAANQLHSIKNIGVSKAVYHAIKWRAKGIGVVPSKIS